MFCEHCHGRAANVHLVRIINGKKSELHLCNECAQGERFKQTENLLNYSMPSITMFTKHFILLSKSTLSDVL